MSLQYRPIIGSWSLPNGGLPDRAIATLTLVTLDYTPQSLVVPDVVRVVVDEDGDVVPAPGYVGQTVEVNGKDRAVIWASEDGERQIFYRLAIEGAQTRVDVAEVLIPSGTAPLTLQEIIELGIAPTDPRYLTLLNFIAGLFRGDWDETEFYLRGQQVRRGAAVYIASEDIEPGVDPLLGAPWDVYLIDAGIPAGGDEDAVLVKLSDVSSDAGWTNTPKHRRVSFDTVNAATLDAAGDVAWDDLDQALSYRTNGITVDIAQENLVYVRNGPGNSTIPKGAGVAVKGASANRIEVQLCSATAPGLGCRTLGVAITEIPSPGFGFVSTFGLLRGFDTTNIVGGNVVEGAELFISATPGVLSTQPQASPGRRVTVGYVVTTGQNGSIFVTLRRGLTADELDDVFAPSPTNGQVLRRNASAGRYEAVTLGPADVGADSAGSSAAVQSNLDAHTGSTTSVHGIADTSALIVEGDARLTDERVPVDGSVTNAKVATNAAINPSKIAGTAVVNNDARLTDERVPVDGSVTNAKVATGADIDPAKIAGTAVVNNDARLTDERVPVDGSVTNAKVATGADIDPAKIAGTAVVNNDARLTDERVPVDGSVTNAKVATGADIDPAKIAGTAVVDNDARLTDARTPVAHANSHKTGGSDQLTAADIGAYPDTNPDAYVDAAGAAAAAPVQSVDGKTGAVDLSGDYDALGSASAVQGNLDTHTGATTSVHGIADTSQLIIEGDARLTDARTPVAHASSHFTGGSDPIAPSDIGAYPDTNPSSFVDAAGAAAAAPVQSVQGQTGAVTFAAVITDEGTHYAITPGV